MLVSLYFCGFLFMPGLNEEFREQENKQPLLNNQEKMRKRKLQLKLILRSLILREMNMIVVLKIPMTRFIYLQEVDLVVHLSLMHFRVNRAPAPAPALIMIRQL